LSPAELELLVCGHPTVDLEVLMKHTVYSPSTYNVDSPVVKNFWEVLRGFSDDQRAGFLQFAWARSRLPSDQMSYRMQLNIVSKARVSIDQVLPTTETCFFNVHLPKYSSIEVMRQKLLTALSCVTITS
jgi:other hect domain ubiquitin protein ligase E3